MKKSDTRKQRKARKARERSKNKAVSRSAGVGSYLRNAREYPIAGCWTLPNWKKLGITELVVARRQPNGNIVFGGYVVDYYLLGVKNALSKADIPPAVFYNEVLPDMFSDGMIEIKPALAHELIYGSIDYAAQFGFKPHRDFRKASLILDPPGAHEPTRKVEFGHEGQPFFIAGPYDNVKAIMTQLNRTVGEGNYHYTVPVNNPEADELLDLI